MISDPVATAGNIASAPIELEAPAATKELHSHVEMSAIEPEHAPSTRFELEPRQANGSVQPLTGRLPDAVGNYIPIPATEESAIEGAEHCGDEATATSPETSSENDDSSNQDSLELSVSKLSSPSTPTLDYPNDQLPGKRISAAPAEPAMVSPTATPGAPERLSHCLLDESSPWAETHALLPQSIDVIRSLGQSFGVTLQAVTKWSSQPFTAMTVVDASVQNNRIPAPGLLSGDVILSLNGQALASHSLAEALALFRSGAGVESDGYIHCRMQVAREAVPQVGPMEPETIQDFGHCSIMDSANSTCEAGSANADNTVLEPESDTNGSSPSDLSEPSNNHSFARDLSARAPATRKKRKITSILATYVNKKFKHHSVGPRREHDGILVQDAQVVPPARNNGIHQVVAPEQPASFVRGLSVAVESCFDQILRGGIDRAEEWEKSMVGRQPFAFSNGACFAYIHSTCFVYSFSIRPFGNYILIVKFGRVAYSPSVKWHTCWWISAVHRCARSCTRGPDRSGGQKYRTSSNYGKF
jgi:hypothetical protein